MKRILLLLVMVISSWMVVHGQTSLEGQVTDGSSGETLPFATVAIYKDGNLITGGDTDFDGNYFFSDIDPGTYDIEASFIGYTAQRQTGVVIQAGKTNRLNFAISEGVLIDAVEIVAYKVPLIEVDNTTSGTTVTADKIRSLPTKSVQGIAATSAGVSSTDGGDISIRGSRADATVYYIDGVRVSGDQNLIPQSEIDQMQIITGGVEAKYGDLVGGAISITSKGPSNNFSGGLELETSEYLDGYGYNLLTANVSGPILRNSEGNSVLGYRFSGQYRDIDDNFPVAGGVWALTEESIKALEADPTFNIGTTRFPSVENVLEAKNFKARPNNGLQDLAVTGKIDARLSDAIDISLSGSYNQADQQFAASGVGAASFSSAAWRFANWTNNPFEKRDGYRGNFRFRHKIGKQGIDEDKSNADDSEMKRGSSVRNFTYTLQFGYEKQRTGREDTRNGDNLFNYGYYGNQAREWETVSRFVDTSVYIGNPVLVPTQFGPRFYGHDGYRQLDGEFTPSTTINAVMAQYNTRNGFIDPINSAWSNLFRNVGQVYDLYSKSEDDIITINVSSGFDFLPGGRQNMRHNIQFGFLYDQRVERYYQVNPIDLWTLARTSANNHLQGIDPNNVIGQGVYTFEGQDYNYDIYGGNVNANDGDAFYKRVREAIGKPVYEYINVDGLDPSQLSLGMFSASELNDQNIIYYYGYDYLGNKLTGNETFEDFFKEAADGEPRQFVSPAAQPIYGAAYIQDKFSFKDLIFRIGVRADYFDANTKVLKDPYSLYELETAQEFFADKQATKPKAVGDDYLVYLDGEGSTNVLGYRKGDQWFSANGESTEGTQLFAGKLVYPSIKNPDAPTIKEAGFDINRSFKDYEPQLNIMPRVAFSFPINEDANFFAHYDVLYQRPATNTAVSPTEYYYFERQAGQVFNNPDLKPVRTVDYEIGYQQKLTNTTAMKFAAYYKEQKDLIQRRVYTNLPAPVGTYETFDNLDFSTVKGFTFKFDRRRVANLELTATYTFQYADGSGSDANSSRGINNRGVIRNLSPLSYDERHRITAVIDYRYGSKNYTGPKIGDTELFKNAGVNFTLAAVSGRPYSKRKIADTRFSGSQFDGAINGSRQPWTFNVDMMLEKGFNLFKSETSRGLRFNAYLRVQNLFDIRNVTDVFSVTGDPDDDGYLVGTNGQTEINSIRNSNRNTEAFLAAYQWRLDSFRNYSTPRRIYFGIRMDF